MQTELTNRNSGELEKKIALLSEINQQKDRFLLMLAHELRTPLTAILGWTQEIMSGPLDPDLVDKAIGSIDRSAKSQLRIVNDMLDLAAVESGRMNFFFENLNFASLLQDTITEFSSLTRRRNLALEFEAAAESTDRCIKGDAVRLTQVFRNLLSNAIKFSGPGGQISVKLWSDDDNLITEITDNGIGIENSELLDIFENTWNGELSLTRKHGGLGLGLKLVKYFVSEHKGYVTAASEGTNKGARFTVTLPVHSFAPESRQSEERTST